jgi:hypothetical protein
MIGVVPRALRVRRNASASYPRSATEALEAARDGRDRLWRDRYVAGVAGREVDDGWAAEDVRDDVDLGGRPAPRGPDALRASPPLPPCAERCALT